MLGWRLPNFVLIRPAARRRLRIEQGIPDAFDVLVIGTPLMLRILDTLRTMFLRG